MIVGLGKVHRDGLVFRPRLRQRIDRRRIGFTHTDVDQVSAEPIKELLVPQTCRGTGFAPSIEVSKERFEVVWAEGGQRPLSGGEVAHEAFEHRFVLDDRPGRERTAIGAGGFRALPLPIGLGWSRQPESVHPFDLIY